MLNLLAGHSKINGMEEKQGCIRYFFRSKFAVTAQVKQRHSFGPNGLEGKVTQGFFRESYRSVSRRHKGTQKHSVTDEECQTCTWWKRLILQTSTEESGTLIHTGKLWVFDTCDCMD